ncbi:MAG: hypothetical protein CME62_13745 [Halobacteriovoraceae bacterium]|nr:hypothetical protein [Halobacteriovoraceae bacterium]|tara:strand:- start:12016 stop:12615 length:600 start_codon:yes stop_codon:yes gene_type:complete
MWKKLDPYIPNYPYLNSNDKLIFAREYQPRQSYTIGETNNLIFNFKKEVKYKQKGAWYYRNQSVSRFAKELNSLFENANNYTEFCVTAIPSSKSKQDPDYDNRFEDMFSVLRNLSKKPISIEWPIEVANTSTASHSGGSRNPGNIQGNFVWNGFNQVPDLLIVVDDVLTSGSHFRAFIDFCQANGYQGRIVGVVWARCV